MNCPNCGAENETEARFCAECGTPLDDVVVESTKVEQTFDETSEDISDSGEAATEAKTLAVDQASVVATAAEEVDNAATVDDDVSPSEPESSPPPSISSSAGEGGSDQNGGGMDLSGSGGNNRTLIIVGVIVLVVLLLCCCCSVLVGAIIGSEPDVIQNLLEEIAMLPVYLAFV